MYPIREGGNGSLPTNPFLIFMNMHSNSTYLGFIEPLSEMFLGLPVPGTGLTSKLLTLEVMATIAALDKFAESGIPRSVGMVMVPSPRENNLVMLNDLDPIKA